MKIIKINFKSDILHVQGCCKTKKAMNDSQPDNVSRDYMLGYDWA
jgi:hypothetical protein